ncbi:DUF3494 domain-containing protein [Candidatus Uhrbacteria bacterium]|nr:DUF3494 domain-containing protein [Candidatus Uhrbacteria bacterium]
MGGSINGKAKITVSAIALVFCLTGIIRAATAVNLDTADDFAVLAGTTITNTGSSVINGDLGLSPGTSVTGFPPGTINGTMHVTDAAAAEAQDDLTLAYNEAAGQTPVSTVSAELGGTTKTAGVYDSEDGTFEMTGTLTLDAQGDPNAVFIFKTDSTLLTAGSSNVSLVNGAQACNVFWQVGSSATLGENSVFKGNILALTSATLTTGANVEGRVLARNGAVTLDTNTVTRAICAAPATLHVIKNVINDNGGTAVASDFTLNVTGTNASPSSFAGSASSVEVTLDAGSYSVTESVIPTGYLASGSGDCSGTIAAGETKTCTITNDDTAPQLIVNKIVINDDGGNGVIADFPLFVDGGSAEPGVAVTTTTGSHTVSETPDSGYTSSIGGDCAADGTVTLALGDVKTCTVTNDDIAPAVIPSSPGGGGGGGGGSYNPPVPPLIDVVKVPSPLALPNGPGPVTYTYTLRNTGTVPATNITMLGDTCSPITLISGDTNADFKLDVDETWVYACSTTLSSTHTNTVTATGWANGISAIDTAKATVIVGLPVVPPLIHVTKIPNPLVLSVMGGRVTYTNKVTNPGTVSLSNIRLTDDRCGSAEYVSGDANGDLRLDPSETWTYTCSDNLTETTVNTVTASGDANGLTARDFAVATVVVNAAVPKLPNTGFPSSGTNAPRNAVVIPIGIFAALSLTYLIRRKRTA